MSALHERLLAATKPALPAGLVITRTIVDRPYAALRALVELHTGQRDGHVLWCTECQGATWPCRTIDAIAEALRVEVDGD